MAKRKSALEDGDAQQSTPKKRRAQDEISTPTGTPSKQRSILKERPQENTNGVATPKSIRKVLFATPETSRDAADGAVQESPLSPARNADRSARRKSKLRLTRDTERDDAEDDDQALGDVAVARQILDEEEEGQEEDADPGSDEEGLEMELDSIEVAQGTPSKIGRPRGRPKGRRRRTPTPPQDLPPNELYFFQNRPGGSKTSSNVFPSSQLLKHEDYFAQINSYIDTHEADKENLRNLHSRGFDQWAFELDQGFNICLYGYGSKRQLAMDFIDHLCLYKKPKVIAVNGYNPSVSLKEILGTLCKAILPRSQEAKLPAQPAALLDLLISHLTQHPQENPIYLVFHSIDALPVRRAPIQAAMARLCSRTRIALLATVDTLNFPLMWDISLKDEFHFLFHDVTTFSPFQAEVDVVDDVNALLGRSGRRLAGKDGVNYVLRSLPENARNLFRILVAEQLALLEATGGSDATMLGNGFDHDDDDDNDLDELLGDAENGAGFDRLPETPTKFKRGKKSQAAPKSHTSTTFEGVEYRTLYHKAVEEFVCSSEMGFRTLLKEFHDHQMIESRKDGLGTETLSVPFAKEELEALLEELV